MEEKALIYAIAALGISVIVNLILKKIDVSQIIGYILTGTIISYTFNVHEISNSHTLELIGEFGIVFLMFTIGLEISINKMASMKVAVFANGGAQVILTSLIFYAISYYLLHIEMIASLIIALALSLSSTAVVLTHLKASKNIYEPYGQRAVGILIFQDIAAIPILVLIGVLSMDGTKDIQHIVIDTTLNALIIFAFLFLVGKHLVTWLLHFSARSNVEELFMGSVLVIVMGASLFAHEMGFTYSLGAFLAGMIIAETKYHHKVDADIAPFKDLLLGAFFLTVGMKIDIAYAMAHLYDIALLVASIFILKGMIIYVVVRISSPKKTSHKTALALSQVGEFSFAIFALASSSSLISVDISQMLVMAIVVSMIITPFVMSNIEKIMDIFFKEKMHERDLAPLKQRRDHVIVCGYSQGGKYIVNELKEKGASPVVIDNNLKHVREAIGDHQETFYGDMSKASILSALNVQEAAAVIVAIDNVEKKRLICEAISQKFDHVNLVVQVSNAREKELFSDLKISKIIVSQKEVAKLIVQNTLFCSID